MRRECVMTTTESCLLAVGVSIDAELCPLPPSSLDVEWVNVSS